jgi:hypothetical protein
MLNTRDGKKRPIEFDPAEWVADLAWEDIAAIDITERIKIGPEGDQLSYVPFSMLATKDFLSYVEFGIGEDGFMLGLFSEHSGVVQNLIAARFGNVSLLADDLAPIDRYDPGTRIAFKTPCHVFDMHSRPGFSGSPVFVYRTPDGDLRDLERRIQQTVQLRRRDPRRPTIGLRTQPEVGVIDQDPNNRFLKLFGIHVGQFHDEVEITKVESASTQKAKNPTLRDGDTIRFPGSMTIIVPAWQILKLLEMPALKQQRDARNTAAKAADSANPKRGSVALESSGAASASPEVSEQNPSHLEDFKRLQALAAKPKR